MIRREELEKRCIRIFLSFPQETHPHMFEQKYLFTNPEFKRMIEMAEDLKKRRDILDFSILVDNADKYDKDALGIMVDLGGTEPSALPLDYYLDQLLELYLEDKLREAIGEVIEKANNNPGGIVEQTPELIRTLSTLYEPMIPASQNKWQFESLKNALKNVSGIEWVIEGWLAFGHVTLLVGVPKIGKSSLLLNMAISVANGDSFLGKEVQKAKVAIASGEDGAPIFQDRLTKMSSGIPEDLMINFSGVQLNEQNCQSLIAKIKKENISVLILDPYVRFHRADENSAEASRALYLLKDVAAKTNTAIIVAHHTRKSGGEHGSEIRGSSAILGAVDLSISLKRVSGEKRNVNAEFIGRICSQQDPWKLEMDETMNWHYTGSGHKEIINENHAAILSVLESDIPKGWSELKEETGLAQGTLQRSLNDLKELGQISQDENKKYVFSTTVPIP
jgi:hypothetical protein